MLDHIMLCRITEALDRRLAPEEEAAEAEAVGEMHLSIVTATFTITSASMFTMTILYTTSKVWR